MIKIYTNNLREAAFRNYSQHVSIKYLYFAKIILELLFIWKILSSDFSNIAFWPTSFIAGYPYDIYPPCYTFLMGIPGIFDLATFHWIHYIDQWPNSYTLDLLQKIIVLFLLFFVISPIRFTRIDSIFCYIFIMYLWGFIFSLGQDIDAVFLLQGILFC